jgi:hypothetical protein
MLISRRRSSLRSGLGGGTARGAFVGDDALEPAGKAFDRGGEIARSKVVAPRPAKRGGEFGEAGLCRK